MSLPTKSFPPSIPDTCQRGSSGESPPAVQVFMVIGSYQNQLGTCHMRSAIPYFKGFFTTANDNYPDEIPPKIPR
jgi:hypothetical protein